MILICLATGNVGGKRSSCSSTPAGALSRIPAINPCAHAKYSRSLRGSFLRSFANSVQVALPCPTAFTLTVWVRAPAGNTNNRSQEHCTSLSYPIPTPAGFGCEFERFTVLGEPPRRVEERWI